MSNRRAPVTNKPTDPWTRIFQVSDPRHHQKGYTIYKVTSTVFPKNAPEAATEVFIQILSVWKRYREFRKLHKVLSTLHTNLHLPGSFPAFSKNRLFGRFQPEVIEERRGSALSLLEFVAQHPPLFTSQTFSKFFEDGASTASTLVEDCKGNRSDQSVLLSAQTLKPYFRGETDAEIQLRIATKNKVSSSEICSSSNLWRVSEDSSATSDSDDKESQNDMLLPLFDPLCEHELCLNAQDDNYLRSDKSTGASCKAEKNCSFDGAKLPAYFAELITGTCSFQKCKTSANYMGHQQQPPTLLAPVVKKTELSNYYVDSYLSSSAGVTGDSTESELKRYKVVGIIDKVLLALDKITNMTCIIKVVPKPPATSRSVTHNRLSRFPTDLPHVVPVLRYHETDDAIILVLMYASRGRLSFYINNIMQTGYATENGDISENVCPRYNIYAGKKFSGNCCCQDTTDDVSISGKIDDVYIESTENVASVKGDQAGKQQDILYTDDNDEVLVADDLLPKSTLRSLSQQISTHNSFDLQQHFKVRNFSSMFCNTDKRSNGGKSNLPESYVRSWASEMATAIMALHSHGFVCRDLNPNNILLDEFGHVSLSFFPAFCGIECALDRHAKDQQYVAPEVTGLNEATRSSDWWSFGTLLYELLTGKTFSSCHPNGFTSHTALNVPLPLSPEAESILKELLCYDPRERLGSGPDGDEAIRLHPFFAQLE